MPTRSSRRPGWWTRFPVQQVYAERLARIYGKLNRAADEAAAWERFIDVSPTPVDACPAIGNAYARAGEPQKSLEAFERCVSFDPRNSEQLFFLGLAYEHAGRTADAMARYSKAAATDPSNADVQLGLGRLALRANKVAEAGRAADDGARALSVQRRRAAAGRTRGGAAGPAAGRADVFRACARGAPRTTSTCTLRSAASRPAPAVAPRRGVTSSARSNWIRRGARSSPSGSSASRANR